MANPQDAATLDTDDTDDGAADEVEARSNTASQESPAEDSDTADTGSTEPATQQDPEDTDESLVPEDDEEFRAVLDQLKNMPDVEVVTTTTDEDDDGNSLTDDQRKLVTRQAGLLETLHRALVAAAETPALLDDTMRQETTRRYSEALERLADVLPDGLTDEIDSHRLDDSPASAGALFMASAGLLGWVHGLLHHEKEAASNSNGVVAQLVEQGLPPQAARQVAARMAAQGRGPKAARSAAAEADPSAGGYL